MSDDRQNVIVIQDRPQAQTARQAAEALFRPKPQVAPAEIPTLPAAMPPSSTESSTPRAPRILSAAPLTIPSDKEPKAPVSLTATLRPRDTRPKARKIPKSAHGRIETLTKYGMTVEDEAELYGVPATEIARIVSTAM